MQNKKIIYLDANATTPIEPKVKKRIEEVIEEEFGNPSSLHFIGRRAARLIEEARQELSSFPGGSWKVIFTSGGTEADALAVLSNMDKKGKKLMISSIEHPAVRENVYYIKEKRNKEVLEVPVSKEGIVDIEFIKENMDEDTLFLGIMLANNEIGSIQPVKEIGKWLKKEFPSVHFHVDIVASVGQMEINSELLKYADSVAISAHKIYGPKGVGALLFKNKLSIKPIWRGGDQEWGIRPGTENIIGIVGLHQALRLIKIEIKEILVKLRQLQRKFINYIESELPEVKLLGDRENRTVGNVTFAYPGLDSEPLLHELESKGVIASSGSACHSRRRGYSHVIKAIGVKGRWAITRFGLHKFLSERDIELAAEIYIDSVKRLREIFR